MADWNPKPSFCFPLGRKLLQSLPTLFFSSKLHVSFRRATRQFYMSNIHSVHRLHLHNNLFRMSLADYRFMKHAESSDDLLPSTVTLRGLWLLILLSVAKILTFKSVIIIGDQVVRTFLTALFPFSSPRHFSVTLFFLWLHMLFISYMWKRMHLHAHVSNVTRGSVSGCIVPLINMWRYATSK